MCGIAGFLAKRADGPVASEVLGSMLKGLRGRGPDSTGLGLYEPAANGSLVVRVWCGDDEAAAEAAAERASHVLGAADHDFAFGILRFRVAERPVAEICRAVEGDDARVEVFSVGRSLQIYKHVTDGEELARHYGLRGSPGRHGVGHARLATESRVDVQHAHPFWARPFADICVVHNGHITNYHKLRRLYEMRGHRFFTGNDSELLALYLARRLEAGETISEAMEASIRDLDGAFSYLLATADGIGIARDHIGSMPAVIAECDDWVAVASEGVAIHGAFDEDAVRGAEFRELGVGAGGDVDAVELDCRERSTREVNAELKRLAAAGAGEVRVLHPAARHCLGVAIFDPVRIRFEGSVGYLCATLGDGADFEVTGDAGWSIGADMHAGSVVVRGGAGTNVGASMKGGSVVVHGSVGTRAAIANKGGTVVIGGDCGYMSAFMFQKGVLVVCGDADEGLGDSMYAGDIYLGGDCPSLGADCVEKELTADDEALLAALCDPHGLRPKRAFRKLGSGGRLHNFDRREFAIWREAM